MQQPAQGRRKNGGGGPRERHYGDAPGHARDLSTQADAVVTAFDERRGELPELDPKLIMKFELNSRVPDVEFARSGLAVLDSSSQHAAVVFASDAHLETFRKRLANYATGPRVSPDGKVGSAPLEGFFDSIDSFRPLEPEDRMSARLLAELDEDPGERTFDIEFWFVADQVRLDEWMAEARDVVLAGGGEWLDSLVLRRSGVAIARCKGDEETIRAAASLDQIALTDVVPQPEFTRVERAELQDLTNLTIDDPDEEAPTIGVVDSGVAAGHPLIAPALAEAVALHPEFGGQAEDGNGHGSMVAGIMLYGDVLAAAKSGSFQPVARIASVRVLDDECNVPEEANFVRVLRDAIVYLVETWECRVINISVCDRDSPFTGGKSTPTAAMLDSLARSLDVVLVVSAGNRSIPDLAPHADTADRHPLHLLDPENGILDPGQAAIAVTVGAIAKTDGVETRTIGTTLGTKAVADPGHPAPFTRRGPGVENATKPELVADGGNLSYDAGLDRLVPEKGAAVVSTSHRPAERLFDASWGTSLAAPSVSHVAAEIVREYPDLSANAIRALLLQGAQNGDAERAFSPHAEKAALEKACMSVAGFGTVEVERCVFSQENRVVMIAEDRIRPDDFHVYRVPITEAFSETPGAHEISVALAFDPPVRHRRFDYLAHKLEFVVVRGIEAETVYELAGADAGDADAPSLSKFAYNALRPPVTVRARGANQMATALTSQRPRDKFSDDWFVVVRSLNRWLDVDADPQHYALSVSLAALQANELYAQVEARLEAELEVLATLE